MAERDTYQIVLQLKDELSSNLKQVNSTLQQTKQIGQQTSESVKGFTGTVKSALQPIRDFSRVMMSVLSAGGLVMMFMRIANAVGDMEKAYVKLHPESQKAVGSLASWNDAMTTMKADTGGIVASVLTPLRAAFLNIIDPVAAATWEIKQLQTELKAIAEKYLTPERKQWQSRQEALEAQTKAQDDFNREGNLATYFLGELTKRQKAYDQALKESKISGNVASLFELQKSVESAKVAWDAHSKAVVDARIALRNVNEWLEADKEKTKTATEAELKAAEALRKTIELRNEEIQLMQYRIALRKELAMQGPEFYIPSQTKEGNAGRAKRAIGRKTAEATEPYVMSDMQIASYNAILTEINRQLVEYRSNAYGTADAVNELAKAQKELSLSLWQDAIVGMAEALGAAAAGTKSLADAMADLVSSILQTIGPLLIQKGLMMLPDPIGWALIAAGGLAIASGAVFGNQRPSAGIPNPALQNFATGGIVSQPTLAMIGEAGPEAVVPLSNPYRSRGYGNIGGITINAPNARYLDGRTAGQLVRQGLAAMRA